MFDILMVLIAQFDCLSTDILSQGIELRQVGLLLRIQPPYHIIELDDDVVSLAHHELYLFQSTFVFGLYRNIRGPHLLFPSLQLCSLLSYELFQL